LTQRDFDSRVRGTTGLEGEFENSGELHRVDGRGEQASLADLKPERLACCHRGHAWHLSQLFADFGREELTGRVLHEEVSGELPIDAPKIDIVVTSAKPIISAEAVAAVRRGLRRAFCAANRPTVPKMVR
jgi:hypothetical protein